MTSYPIFTGTIDPHYAQACEHFDYLVGRLNHEESRKLTHGEVEDLINTEGMELLRRLNQAYLERRSTEEPDQGSRRGRGWRGEDASTRRL